MTPRYVSTIEARMTSSRLPGKIMMPAAGKPMIGHLINRLRTCPSLDGIVLATTTNDTDDPLADYVRSLGVHVHRGSEEDVLARVIGAAEQGNADVIVEITGDCPIIDPELVEQCCRMHRANRADYVSNAHVRSYPDGMDVQVFPLDVLRRSASMTDSRTDREHVSLFIRSHPELFSHLHLVAPPRLHWPELGLTLDERSDYELLRLIIERLSPCNPVFGLGDVLELVRREPALLEINRTVVRKG